MKLKKVIKTDNYLADMLEQYRHIKHFSVDKRTEYFNECWHMWADNRLTIELSRTQILYLRKKLREIGLYEWEDYIFRHGKELRFRSADDLAMIKLTELI